MVVPCRRRPLPDFTDSPLSSLTHHPTAVPLPHRRSSTVVRERHAGRELFVILSGKKSCWF